MEETWTILRVIQWTTQYFARCGIEQPRTDAEVLLAHILGVRRLDLYLRHDQPLRPAELATYRALIRRRTAHEPVQYITGRQEFWSLELEVTPAVLIPRPETELLVEKALEFLAAQPAATPRVLEVGTGSGAIAVALAHSHPQVAIVASDISPGAIAVARRNALRHEVAGRIAFVAADLLTPFRPACGAFDGIVSNPPYVAKGDLAGLPPHIRHHEPAQALDGGEQGLNVIRRLVSQAPPLLKPGGWLLVEIGAGQSTLLEREMDAVAPQLAAEFNKDYAGIARVMVLRQRGRDGGVRSRPGGSGGERGHF